MPDRKPWAAFSHLTSAAPLAQPVLPADLCDMATYAGDSLDVFVAYAQDNHIFDGLGRPVAIDAETYARAPRESKVNKFGQAYRGGAKLWLHKHMAGIVVDAARFMQARHGWKSLLYDGLRTVDGAYCVYRNAEQKDLDDGLLAPPGLSAHNKGMAVDLVQFDREGALVAMGGNFDHLDMAANHRNNASLPPEVIQNRRQREIAFQHAALSHGKLFAPLRSEFWDERFPENSEDHWRVLESLCRCLGRTLLSAEAARQLKAPKGSPERDAFRQAWEQMDYAQFTRQWQALFDEKELRAALDLPASVALPPARETIIYHGDFHPLYDRDLPEEKRMTDTQK